MDYVVHALNIKKWEWEAVKERMDMQIAKEGPFEEACNVHNTAVERIAEIEKAIKILSNEQHPYNRTNE